MRILDGTFVKSIAGTAGRKGMGLPEICFVGRSNVGKSSLLNTLAQRRIARTSSTPGATRLINLYSIRYEFEGKRRSAIFSDFPGFGFSKVSREVYQSWQSMIEGYIVDNEWIRRILWAFDVRRDFDDLDYMLLDWFREKELPFSLIVTKTDKEGRNRTLQKKLALERTTGTTEIFLFSSRDGYGRDELLSHIARTIG